MSVNQALLPDRTRREGGTVGAKIGNEPEYSLGIVSSEQWHFVSRSWESDGGRSRCATQFLGIVAEVSVHETDPAANTAPPLGQLLMAMLAGGACPVVELVFAGPSQLRDVRSTGIERRDSVMTVTANVRVRSFGVFSGCHLLL
jgi:hypothetical protein